MATPASDALSKALDCKSGLAVLQEAEDADHEVGATFPVFVRSRRCSVPYSLGCRRGQVIYIYGFDEMFFWGSRPDVGS
jgi:hypothetical protein